MTIRAVLFDLDNTLTDDYESTRLAIAKACRTAAEAAPWLAPRALS